MRAFIRLAVCLAGINSSIYGIDWHVDPAAGEGGDGRKERPFGSLSAAIAALPGAPEEPLVLRLAAGVHRIGSPLEITPRHARGHPLLFDGGGKAVISGGKRLDSWTIGGGKWIHLLAKEESTRELFVNGERRPRSRFPQTNWLRVAEALPDKRSGFTTQSDLPAVGSGTELVFLHDWSISRIPVASIEGRLLRTTGPIGFPAAHFVIDHYEPNPRFCLENGPSFLIEKGSWCHENGDESRIIYIPRDGETPENTVIEMPVARQLLKITGTAEEVLRDVRIKGITFEHCRWEVPPSGYAEGQATKHVPRDAPTAEADPHGQWKFVDWAVIVERAEQVVFEQCRFRNLGGGGVLLGQATRSCALENCHVADVSGNGIGIGEGGERRLADGRPWWQAAPEDAATNNVIRDCLVERCGAQFHGAVGIWVGLARDCRIVSNEVRHLPYTGISVGWMWNPTPSPCGGNIVEGNHIHHVMQLLSDGGGIYTLGRQPGTILRENLIHDVPLNTGRAESNGMFLDEGSSGFLIDNNLIHGVDRSPLRFHKAGKLDVTGNAWLLAPGMPPLRFNNTDPALIDARENTVVDAADLAGLVRAWKEKHPPPSVP